MPSRSTCTASARSSSPWAARSARCAAWVTSWNAAMAGGERLRDVLLSSLLVPLVALLVVDSALSWWTSERLADQAYDRGLHEIAREVALHVHATPEGARLDLTPAAEQALLVDQDDRLALHVWSESGAS